ncbi:hypothetical protein HOY82DRAFT_639186 [Tuber indicum]|nr:hypothetical protein HOY82DRAFT_639186 [Tuber indicum]
MSGKTILATRVAAEFLKLSGYPSREVKFVCHFVPPELPTDGISADEAGSPHRRLAKVAWDLLYGILQQNGKLFDIYKAELENQGDEFLTNSHSSWKILRKAIQNCPAGPVYILVDGVDGLGGRLCKELIERILKLMDIPKVKIFLSSREVPHISNNLCECTRINLGTSSFVKADVETFIKGRVDKFGGWNVDQKEGAIGALLTKSEGIFLWASLSIENLKRFSTGPDYEEFLRKLPSELKDVYRKMLCDVRSREGSEKVLTMIRDVALALRPLTFGEFGYILECMEEEAKTVQLPPRKGKNPEFRPRTEVEIKQYARSSMGFLRASDTTVSIFHHTATEYLFDKELQDSLQVPTKGELDLTASWECFRYLHSAFADPEESPNGNDWGSHDRSQESSLELNHQEEPAEAPWEAARRCPQEALAKWPYLKYAAESWFIHARRSIEIADHEWWGDSTRNWLEHQFFTSAAMRKPWIELCGDPKMMVLAGDQTPLSVAVCLGLTPLVEKALLDSNTETRNTSNNQSPLHLAAKFISGAYEILIAKGSPSLLTVPDQHGNTPLHEAAISGHILMLAGLVKKFTTPEYRAYSGQINKQNEFGDTPLHLAIQFDRPDIAKFLVENHADLAIENSQGLTALKLGEELERGDSLDILQQAEMFCRAEREIVETIEETAGGAVEGTVEETMDKREEFVKDMSEALIEVGAETNGMGVGESKAIIEPSRLSGVPLYVGVIIVCSILLIVWMCNPLGERKGL